MPGMKSIIVGTAGHIDHGKTALVKALTGIDADRLEEEKRRGITIDLGFAHLELPDPSGEIVRIGFVDVPGHERFVRNMLAGIGGIDLVLLDHCSRRIYQASNTRALRYLPTAVGSRWHYGVDQIRSCRR